MAKKKQPASHISQEDNVQAQHLFEHYHHIARQLRNATSRVQVESALTPITESPASVQLALLKTLAKEPQTDSADVLFALNETSPIKDVRKEAKRSLIQLQGANIAPQLAIPAEALPTIVEVEPEVVGNAPRFWKGSVSNSRDAGEVQLILAWEQGKHYREVRVLGFLLELWHDGVKDFFTRVQSKTTFEHFLNRMTMEAPDVSFSSCSLAEGRRLILEALEVNKQYHTHPHSDYQRHQSLINELILENPDIEDKDEDEDEESVVLHDLDPETVAAFFVENWVNGDFDIAYDLLASESPLREGLSRADWTARREEWLEEADPGVFEPVYMIERKSQVSKLWLPNPSSARNRSPERVFEASWSFEMEETPLSETLPELPQPTAVYAETERHWFWASFSLIQDADEWRIQTITDEAKNALERSPEELRASIQSHFSAITDISRKHKPTDKDALKYVTQVVEHAMQAANYSDALIKKIPDDPTAYEEMASLLFTLQFFERGLIYMEPFTRLFSPERAAKLRSLAAAQRILSGKYAELEDEERSLRLLELAEQALIESLSIEDNFAVRISLVEVLIEQGDRLDEAEEHLQRASAFATKPDEIAHVEMHRGEIAMEQELYEEALPHYQKVVELEPNLADSWADLASAYQELGNIEEAESNYRHAIQLDPLNEDLYRVLSSMFMEEGQLDRAIAVVKEGLSRIPDSVGMYIALATMYVEQDDLDQAEHFVQQAERLDPDSPYVAMIRQILHTAKQNAATSSSRLSRKERRIGTIAPAKFHKSQKKRR